MCCPTTLEKKLLRKTCHSVRPGNQHDGYVATKEEIRSPFLTTGPTILLCTRKCGTVPLWSCQEETVEVRQKVDNEKSHIFPSVLPRTSRSLLRALANLISWRFNKPFCRASLRGWRHKTPWVFTLWCMAVEFKTRIPLLRQLIITDYSVLDCECLNYCCTRWLRYILGRKMAPVNTCKNIA